MSSLTLTLERAIFGEIDGGGHGVRASTFNSPQLSTLAMRLDLPDQPPAGVMWHPYLAGFPFEDRYVFAYVQADSTNPRGGMLVSRALIAKVADLEHLNRLDLLAESLKAGEVGTPLQNLTMAPQPRRASDCGPLPIGLANVLAEHSTAPAILVQGDGAEDALVSIWEHLPASVRANFAFRLGFSQRDLVDTPLPAVIFIPGSLESRWPSNRIARPERECRSTLAGVLCGTGRGAPLMEFFARLEVAPTSIEDLALGELTLQHLRTDAFDDTLAAIRLIERLSPDPTAGTAEKERLVVRLAHQLQGQPYETALYLRNLKSQALRSLDPLWAGLRHRLGEMPFSAETDAALTEIFAAASDKNLEGTPWRQTVINGLTQAVKSAPDEFSQALWRYRGSADGLAILAALESPQWDVTKVSAKIPSNATKHAAEVLEGYARRHGLNVLLAAALRVQYSLVDACARYAAFDPAFTVEQAVDTLMREAAGTEIVALVERHADNGLLSSAARALVHDPTRFRATDFRQPGAQRLWAAALAISPAAWSAPSDRGAVVGDLLKTVASGGPVDPELLAQLSRSEYADLSGNSDRAKVWAHLPAPLVDAFLERTAGGWLRSLGTSTVPLAPDDRLEGYILRRRDLAGSLAQPIKNANVQLFLTAINALPHLPEDMFIAVLDEMTPTDSKLMHADSVNVGRFIAEKEWAKAALKLKDLYDRRRADLRPALEACQSLLSGWTRYSLGLATPGTDESWEMLRDVAVHLYGYGPDHDYLWERAGGKNSELPKDGTGAARWFQVIQLMRRGIGVKADRLIREMRKDYANNQELEFLSRLPVFRSKGGFLSTFRDS